MSRCSRPPPPCCWRATTRRPCRGRVHMSSGEPEGAIGRVSAARPEDNYDEVDAAPTSSSAAANVTPEDLGDYKAELVVEGALRDSWRASVLLRGQSPSNAPIRPAVVRALQRAIERSGLA